MSSPRRLTSAILALALGAVAVDGVVQGLDGRGAARAQTRSQREGTLQLTLRRKTKALEVVLEGVGERPELQQRLNNGVWEGQLRTQGTPGLMRGPQTLSLPELGIEAVSLSGVGDRYQVTVRPVQGQPLKDPVVSADGRNLILTFSGLGTPQFQTGRLDLNTPGRVPQPRYAPPLRPRAVAPPLGDMAVGTMVLQNRSYLNLPGPTVPGVNFSDADAKVALKLLAKQGGYGFVFSTAGDGSDQKKSEVNIEKKISVYLNEVSFSTAFNTVLLASGYQARLEGKTLIVGPKVMGLAMGPTMSKVFRLNQVSAESAKIYLGNLGAKIQGAVTVSSSSVEEESASGQGGSSGSSASTQTSTADEAKPYGADVGPLVGLRGTTDSRLNTITLIGESSLVSVAEGYLKQIDLRKRQVAVRVQILNIDLTNDKQIESSFSAKFGDTFIVSDGGRAFMNFGAYKPGGSAGTGVFNGGEINSPNDYSGPERFEAQSVVPSMVEKQAVVSPPFVQAFDVRKVTTLNPDGSRTVSDALVPRLSPDGQPLYVRSNDPAASPTLVPQYDSSGRPILVPSSNPADAPQTVAKLDKNGQPIYVEKTRGNQFSYPDNSFYSFVEAAIISNSAKTLAQPTLLVQEGEKASVITGTDVVTSATETTTNSSVTVSTKKENAGLTLEVSVERIDDNGFITLSLSPDISVPIPAGSIGNIPLFNISQRKMSSGMIRLRDRQTLVLTGVIRDEDKAEARKWPILGDLPFVGQLFRSNSTVRTKNELVILVTPSIVDDEADGSYGYGYRPSTKEARQLMGPG